MGYHREACGRPRAGVKAAIALAAVVGVLLAAPSMARAHGGGNFAAPATSTPPTIDGTIGAGEWADAASYTLTFGSLPATVRFMEDGTNLYVAVMVEDAGPGANPKAAIVFDNNHDGINGTGDDDWLAFPTFGSDFSYSPTGTGGRGYYNDLTDPATGGPGTGTNDTLAAGSIGAGQVSFEISHPLCSSDTSHDICASAGQTLGVDFQYEPDTGPGVFWNAPGPELFDPGNNWADLLIGGDTTPPTVTLTQPDAGAVLRGKVRVAANASDNAGVLRVDFIYRGRLQAGGPLVDTVIGSATNGSPATPYYITFDTTQFPNTLVKDATIFARAYDGANNSTLSVGHAVTIDNTGPGQIVFESDRDGNSEIWSMAPDGTNLKQLTHTNPPVVNTRPSLSPDGRTIVFERTTSGATQVYSMMYDGTNEQQLTTSPGNSGAPAFSPDGTKIAFHSDRATGKRQIYVMSADGSNQTRVTNNDANDVDPSWNDDGTQLAITSDRSGNYDIWTVSSVNGSSAVDVTATYSTSSDSDPDWSPDGQTILFVSDRGGATSVWRMNADGTSPQNLTDASIYDADVAWAPDGKHLAFVRDAGGQDFNVWTARPAHEFGGPDFNVDFGNAQLRLTDVCIGYTIGGVDPQTYTIESPPSSANCNITQDRSISGDTPTSITFDNQSGRTVDIYWLDYEGNRVYYSTLGNENIYTQPTYLTHPWVMIATGPWRNSFPDWGPLPSAPRATNMSLTATPTSSAAGAAQVKLANVPPLALILPQAGLQSAPVNQSPVNQSPVNQTPINQLATTNAPVNQTPVNQSPVNQSPVNQSGFAELTQSISQLESITLSTIPLLRTGGWSALLTGTSLAGLPEQNVTLRQVYALNPLPGPLQPGASNPIKIGELDLSRSPLGTVPAIAFSLGKLPLSEIDTTVGSSTTFTDWCTSANVTGVDCTGTLSNPATVLSTSIQGAPVNQSPVNQSPVNQSLIQALAAYGTPVNQTPVNQTPINQSQIGALPVNQTPVNQTPINQLSLQNILLANAPVNQSPINQTPVNQLSNPDAIVDCSLVNCTSSTTTLGSAFAANAIRAGVTLGDLRANASTSLLASWTIAALRYYGNMTIGDLLVSLPQPNSFTLADVLLLVLGSPDGVQGLSFEGINIFDTALQQVATGGPTMDYRAQFTVSPTNGGPSEVANTVTVSSTLGTGFLYVPGSSKVLEGTSCSGATGIGDPTSTVLANGRLKLTWSIDTSVGHTYSVCFTTRPGLVLGPQGASLSARPDGGSAASATPTSVDIGDTLEPNDAASTSPLVSNDSFYLSYLTSASDVDYYRFTAPSAGTVVTFHLSHLPTDYDLVVYGPPETALRPPLTTGAVPLDVAPVTDSGVNVTSTTGTLASQTLDDLRLQTDLPMVGVSASRGTDPEDIVVISQGTGTYTVQITGYNGATSAKPYMLRVATAPPRSTASVPPTTVTGTVGPALPNLPSGLNTVFLVNRQRLQSFYSDARATNVMNALSSDSAAFASLGFPNVVLSVDRFTTVQNAYAAWNATPGSPAAANGVVQAINGVLDSQIRSQPNGAGLKYLVIVGGDKIIPFARLDDFTVTASNETGYANTFATTSDLFASLNAGQMLSDDPFGDVNPVPYLTRQLYIPELSVGRLVETPEDIVATLNRFVSPLVNGRLDPTTSLTTGYDFLYDGAQVVNSPLNARFGTQAQTLLDNPAVTGDSWTLSQLIGAFLPTATGTSAPSITSLNGHASHFQFQPPSNDSTGAPEPLLTTSAVTGSSSSLTNRLIFSMGCHAGLSVADSIVTATTLDWPQAFAQKGVGAFLGNTGYGYGDSLVVAYSEELNRLFSQRIAAGAAVGDALAAAKQAYYGELGVFGVYDEKAMAEFTLYGLPMWSITAPPAGTGQAQAQAFAAAAPTGDPQAAAINDTSPSAQSAPITTDPTTGLDTEAFSVDPTNTPTPSTLGTYWSGPDGVQVTHLRPLQPKALVGLSGTTGHGALITELTSGDTNCVDPVFARPIVDLSANEQELRFGDVAFPSKLQTVRTFETPTGRLQQLVLVTGQFFTQTCSGNPDPQLGVQRLFSHIAGRVFRATSNDYVSPAFQLIEANQAGGNASFIVDVTDKTQTGAAGTVKQVLVGVRSGTDSNWTFLNLAQSPSNAARWTGGTAISGSQFEYFVQAVDAVGNVGISTNKGFYFAAAPPPPPPTGNIDAELNGPQAPSGWYTAAPTLSVTAPAGVTTEVSVDGGAYGPAPSTITGDGLHTVDVRASNGGTATLLAPVDTSSPTIVINTPVQGAQYVLNSAVKADYFCLDAGSGVASCPGTVPNGSNIDTSSLGAKTFTVGPATDRAGHTASAVTVTYTVVRYRKVLFSSPSSRTDGGDIYAMNADGSGTAARLTTSSALDEQPSWSPDGSKIAFASDRNNSKGSVLDIFVMDANGTNVRRLTFAGGDDTAPAWSADGSKIAFQSKRDGNPEIYVMNNDGTGQRRLTFNTTQDAEPAWGAGPNAQKITFLSNRTNAILNVWVMDSSGANQRPLTSTAQPDGTPSFSPDGTKILFASKRGSNGGTVFDIYTMDPSTGTILQRLTNSKGGDFEPSWSRDGTRIAFTSLRDGNQEIYTMNAAGSDPLRLTTNAAIDHQPDW